MFESIKRIVANARQVIRLRLQRKSMKLINWLTPQNCVTHVATYVITLHIQLIYRLGYVEHRFRKRCN